MKKITFNRIINIFHNFIHNNKLSIITAVLLFTASFLYRLIILLNSEFPPGTDCFVYLIQVKSLLTEGKLHYEDISPIYHIMLPFFKIFKDDFTAYKVFLSLLASSSALGTYLLGRSLKKNNYLSTGIAIWVAVSPSLTFFLFQFPKNYFASVLFLFSILFFVRKKVIKAILLIAAASISHKMIAGTAVLFFAAYAFFFILQKYRKYALFAVCGTLIFTAILFFTGILKIFDFSRFEGVFSFIPQLPHYSFYSLLTYQKMNALWILETVMLFLISIFFLYRIIKSISGLIHTNNISTALSAVSLCLLFPFLNFSPEGIAFRLFMQYFFITYIAFIFIMNISLKESRIFLLAMLFLTIPGYFSYNSLKIDPPYILYKETALEAGRFHKNVSDFELFVAHKPLAEVIDYYTDEDALPWDPEDSFNKNKTYRLVNGITAYELLSIGDINYKVFKELPGYYYIITEKDWEIFIQAAEQYNDKNLLKIIYSARNPYIQRPKFVKDR